MKRILATLFLTILTLRVLAIPAFPGRIVFNQPNARGVSVSIYLKGDERVHWAESLDGYSLMYAEDGNLVYATRDTNGDMTTTNLIATEIEDRSPEVNDFLKQTPTHLRYSKRQVDQMLDIWQQVENAKSGPKTMSDVTGEKKFLVILFGFSDQQFTFSKTAFRMLFNQVGYSSNSAIGSVHDYYYDVSGGQFSLRVDVVGPFTGVYNTNHYGNTSGGYQDFAHEAVDSAAKYVDFSDYDNDGDGYIDGLHIIFAGHGEEAGAGASAIWSHKWNIFDPPTYNNTVVDVYSCSPECKSNNGTLMTAIGVICHELGHVFGAPDFYDTDYGENGGEYPGLGSFDIMSGGSWNRGGLSPAHHNPYTKTYIYHWTTTDTLDGTSRQYVLPAVEEHPNAIHRVNTSTPGDFFLIENRQPIKWDNPLPGHGMVVYHIHPDAHGASVSNYRHPQQIYIVAYGSATDTFPTASPSSYGFLNGSYGVLPGTLNRRDSLTDNSIPWFRPWSKQPNNIPLRYISEQGQNIYFCVQDAQPNALTAEAEGLDRERIAVRWHRHGSYPVMVAMAEAGQSIGSPEGNYAVGETLQGGGRVVYVGTGNSTIVDSLLVGRTYRFRIFTQLHDGSYTTGIDAEAATTDCDASTWSNEDFESTDCGQLPACWAGTWSVDSLMGQKALRGDGGSVMSRIINYDSAISIVVHLRVHFYDGCDQTSSLRVDCRATSADDWTPTDTVSWLFAMPTWKDVYIPLCGVGTGSRLRFTFSGSGRIAIDDLRLVPGFLVYAEATTGGTINPAGNQIFEVEATPTYTLTPAVGYEYNYLKLNGARLSNSKITRLDDGTVQYTFDPLNDGATLEAGFSRKAAIDAADPMPVDIYPNPNSGQLTVNAPTGSLIQLYDLTGHLLQSVSTTSNATTIDLGQQPRGIYILRLNGQTHKVVKK